MRAGLMVRPSLTVRRAASSLAAARFKDVVDRWNAESLRLYHVLHTIAETIRHNEATLRDAGQDHARHIAAAGGNL